MTENAFYATAGISADTAAQAENILQSYTSAVAAAKADSRLTPEAKQVDMARAYTKAQTDMAGVQAAVEQQEAATVDRLARNMFGNSATTGTDAVSARDADDRAARLSTPEEARAALDRATVNGDTVLARSIALKAYQEAQGPFGGGAWGDVLRSYGGSRPGVAADLAELANVSRSSNQKSLNRAALFGAVAKPAELRRYSDGQIATIAAQQ
jgi:hypothetical protein